MHSIGWRTFYISVLFAGSLLVAFYNSRTVADNTVSRSEKPFRNLLELAGNKIYHPILYRDTSSHHFFKTSTYEDFSAVWNRINMDVDSYTVTSTDEIMRLINCCHAAHIGPIKYISFLKSVQPSLELMDNGFLPFWMGIAFQKNSPITRMFNHA
ncbi:hypothetical protein GQR58_026595 [Nymphon striatum]|nr:hypothetical protein GQR58_026595 [Nymphon striatum]